MSARTEFVAADAANEWAAIWVELRRLAGLYETLVTAKLDQTEVNGDVRRRLAKVEQLENMPKSVGYSRSGPAQDWRDGTILHPKGEGDE